MKIKLPSWTAIICRLLVAVSVFWHVNMFFLENMEWFKGKDPSYFWEHFYKVFGFGMFAVCNVALFNFLFVDYVKEIIFDDDEE